MVLVEKWPFFYHFFLGNIGQENVFYDILERKKTPFQAIKTRSLKNRKIDTFPKGLTHGFSPKMATFPTFFFYAIQNRKMYSMIFQNEKTPYQAIKIRSLKSRKMNIFPKGLTHGFGPKMVIFQLFLLFNLGQENVFYDILKRKNAFVGCKNKKFKKSKKLTFFQGA